MSFLPTIFDHLEHKPQLAKLSEIHLTTPRGTDGTGMLELIARARASIRAAGVSPGDRVATLAPNSVRWVAADLAALAEGGVVVPMFDRSGVEEIGKILRSSTPKLVIVGSKEHQQTVEAAWPERGDATVVTHQELFAAEPITERALHEAQPSDVMLVIYTSGTSGEPKGVRLTKANLDFMIEQTKLRLAEVAPPGPEADRIFHFLPFCFAASRLMLWTQLARPNPMMLSTDVNKLQAELATAKPNFFLTVPMVLERLRSGIEDNIAKQGNVVRRLYARAVKAHQATVNGKATVVDHGVLALAKRLIFKQILARIGPNLDFVIAGSAPLAEDTQRWMQMLGVPVYQVYGLTETTGIVSIDKPNRVTPGRVGFPIDGLETRITEEGELQVRGPNIFDGYWNNPKATAEAMDGEWFRTGDQVEIQDGSLKVIGRLKNLIIPESGHNVAPEPLEEELARGCPSAKQCVLVGHGKPFLVLIATGSPNQDEVDQAIAAFNERQPYYKKVKQSILVEEELSAENGLLTANLKLRRRNIEAHFQNAIDAVYQAYYAEKKRKDAATPAKGQKGEA